MLCLHAGCVCEAAEGEDYCGEYCCGRPGETEHPDHACECGSPSC